METTEHGLKGISYRPVINKLPPVKGLDIRIPTIWERLMFYLVFFFSTLEI